MNRINRFIRGNWYVHCTLIFSTFLIYGCQESTTSASIEPFENVEEIDISVPKPEFKADSSFVVFDGTRFKDKPEMTRFGFTPVEIIYQVRLWDKDMDYRDDTSRWELPLKRNVTKWAQQARKVNPKLAIIDIEHWPTKGEPAMVQRSLGNYATVYDWFKQAEPEMQFGYYDMVPVKNHWVNPSVQRLEIWNRRNDLLQPLADKVDALFPHLYTYSKDQEFWVKSAEYYLKEAHRLSGGKPVYAFLWPQYYSGHNELLRDEYIDGEFWRLQLETARKHADGVVIWFPIRIDWEQASNAPWWETTKTFIQELKKS